MISFDTSLPVRRITPTDGHYFFGYYDLQPFSKNGNYYLTHKTTFMDRLQKRGDVAQIGIIHMENGKFEHLETTKAWNFQQGAMLQWNPTAPDREIIYNDVVDGEVVGVLMDIHTGCKRYLERAVANVSKDGKYALGINMPRLYDFRPGYGYAEPGDAFYYKKHSDKDGVFLIDMSTGKSKLVLSMQEIWDFSGAAFSKEEKMVINHITFNPDASRFLFLVRNFPPNGAGHRTALITADRDGKNLYLLSDYGVQSHYYWLNNKQLVIYAGAKELACARGWGNNYILTDQTHDGEMMAGGFFYGDNHMSFSPDLKYMVTDRYPDPVTRMQNLRIYCPVKEMVAEIGRYYSMPSDVIDIRCDLHPRWNRNGDRITFDSTHEGFRGVYMIEFSKQVREKMFEEGRYE